MAGLEDISDIIEKKVEKSDEEEWLKELAIKLVKHERYHDTTGREGYSNQFEDLAEQYKEEVE